MNHLLLNDTILQLFEKRKKPLCLKDAQFGKINFLKGYQISFYICIYVKSILNI